MKRSALIFLATILLTYGYQGFKTYYNHINENVKVKTSGLLSDITSNVISIPLETPDSGAIKQIKRVQRDRDNIFLLGDQRLLHFDVSGKLISQIANDISDNEDVFIADYVIDRKSVV